MKIYKMVQRNDDIFTIYDVIIAHKCDLHLRIGSESEAEAEKIHPTSKSVISI